MAQKMSKIIAFFTLAASLFHSGCGMVALIGTPSESEKKIPAEYNFAEHTNQKILILVKQPAYLTTQINLRYHLTRAIRRELIAKVEIPPERFIDYGELSRFRASQFLLHPHMIEKTPLRARYKRDQHVHIAPRPKVIAKD